MFAKKNLKNVHYTELYLTMMPTFLQRISQNKKNLNHFRESEQIN